MLRPDNKTQLKQFTQNLNENQNINIKKLEPKIIENNKFTKQVKLTKQRKYYGPVQGDFSKISSSYVIENDRLRKKSIVYNKKTKKEQNQYQEVHNEQYDEQIKSISNIQLIKQKAKLEFLDKKGYLKPQQKVRLQKIRSQQKLHNMIEEPINFIQERPILKSPMQGKGTIQTYKKQIIDPKLKPSVFNNENNDPNFEFDQQFSFNNKMMPPANYYNQNYTTNYPNNQSVYHENNQNMVHPHSYPIKHIPYQNSNQNYYGNEYSDKQNYQY